jgi:hypothetical protein
MLIKHFQSGYYVSSPATGKYFSWTKKTNQQDNYGQVYYVHIFIPYLQGSLIYRWSSAAQTDSCVRTNALLCEARHKRKLIIGAKAT